MAMSRRGTLARAIMVALVVAAVVPVMALGAWFVAVAQQQAVDRAVTHLSFIADSQVARVDIAYRGGLSTLAQIASRTQMARDLEARSVGVSVDESRLAQIIGDARAAVDDLYSVVLIDARGEVVAASGGDDIEVVTQLAQSLVERYAAAVGTVDPVALRLPGLVARDGRWMTIVDIDGEARWLIATWVKVDGARVGAAVVDVDMTPIVDMMVDATSVGNAQAGSAKTCLYVRGSDASAVPIISSLPHRPVECGLASDDGSRSARAIPAQMSDTPAQLALAGVDTTMVDVRDARGRRVVATTRYVDGAALGLTVTAPRDTVLAPVRMVTAGVIAATIVVAALAAAIALIVGRRLLRPLTALHEAVVNVGANEDASADARQLALNAPGELGEVATAVATMADTVVAQRRALEHRVSDLEVVAHAMAHDLKGPLTALRGMLETVAGGRVVDPEQRDELVTRARQAAERMQLLIDDLLVVVRANESGELACNPVDLNEIVAQALAALDLHGGVEAELLPTVAGDAVLLRQVFVNLIGNAIAYHPDGVTPRVRIAASSGDVVPAANGEAGGRLVAIHVDDAGVGIAAEEREKVVAMFVRGSEVGDRPGSGIGLGIVARVVERHGGIFELNDSPLGGTRATVWLPFADDVPSHHSGEAT